MYNVKFRQSTRMFTVGESILSFYILSLTKKHISIKLEMPMVQKYSHICTKMHTEVCYSNQGLVNYGTPTLQNSVSLYKKELELKVCCKVREASCHIAQIVGFHFHEIKINSINSQTNEYVCSQLFVYDCIPLFRKRVWRDTLLLVEWKCLDFL